MNIMIRHQSIFKKSKIFSIILLVSIIINNFFFIIFVNGEQEFLTDEVISQQLPQTVRDKLKDTIVMLVGSEQAYVNNQKTQVDADNKEIKPFISEGRTLVPLRFISESLGAKVDWDQSTQTITVAYNNKVIKMVIANLNYNVNGQECTMDVPAQTMSGRTFIPLRTMVEALDKKVFWDDRGLIIISNYDEIFNTETEKDAINQVMAMFSDQGASTTERALMNTFSRLKQGLPLTIGYLGGSITAGTGASSAKTTSWRALTTAWFRSNYPDATINEANAAIGGTGSGFGAYRCQTDLLDKKPNLVFVEFAVNDASTSSEMISRAMEGIVRHIWTNDPKTDIVFIYTCTADMARTSYDQGSTPRSVVEDQKVADYYGIPSVNVGKVLAERINSQNEQWKSYTIDNVHPNDAGYAIYSDEVQKFLQAQAAVEAPDTEFSRTLPQSINEKPLDTGRFVDAWEADASSGWKRDETPLGHYPHMLTCDTAGETLNLKFRGNTIGLYILKAPDSGDFEWSVDDGKTMTGSTWDKDSIKSSRTGSVMLDNNLSEGEHVLHLKVLGSHQEKSKGNWVKLGAFMISGN